MISREDAQKALAEVEQTQTRVNVLDGYRGAAPHLILWGLVWFSAYALSDFFPMRTGLIWLTGDTIGMIGSCIFAARQKARAGVETVVRPARFNLRPVVMVVVILLFVSAVITVMGAADNRRISTVFTLTFALLFSLMGIWGGVRLLAMGLCLGAVTMAGYFWVHDHYALFLGVTGGGTLLLSGLLLRRA